MKTLSTIAVLLILIPGIRGMLIRVFLFSDPYLGEVPYDYFIPNKNGIEAYPSEDNAYGRYILFPGPTNPRTLSNQKITQLVEPENSSPKWLLMIGTSTVCCFTLQRIIIQRRLYKEVPTTRLIEREDNQALSETRTQEGRKDR